MGGGGAYLCASVSMSVHGCVLMIHQMGTADAEIWSTKHFQALSLLRDDVHLEDFIHFMILANQVTVTVRGLGLCCCVSCYVCDICRLLFMLLLSVSLFVVLLTCPTVVNSANLISTISVHSASFFFMISR